MFELKKNIPNVTGSEMMVVDISTMDENSESVRCGCNLFKRFSSPNDQMIRIFSCLAKKTAVAIMEKIQERSGRRVMETWSA